MKKPTDSSTPTPRPKTIIISGNDRGGVGKTFNNVQLGDALECLGYNVAYVDADPGSNSMQEIVPSALVVDPRREEDLNNLAIRVKEDNSDAYIVDLGAGQTAHVLGKYFRKNLNIYNQLGLRIVVGVSINSDSESIKCSIPWAQNLADIGEFVTLINHEKPLEFDIARLPAAEDLIELSEGRVIDFPRLGEMILKHYSEIKGRAGDYCEGGALVEELGIGIFELASWQDYRNSVVLSVFPHAEWITGRSCPRPPHPLLVNEEKMRKGDATAEKMRKRHMGSKRRR
jgi:AAA domain